MANEERKNTFEITLADGTQLSGLGLNGNNFISTNPVTDETFLGKLGHVKISGNAEDGFGLVGEHEHMELVQIQKNGSEYWFILRDIPAAELEKTQMQGNIAYLAMMSGIDLDK